MENFAQLQLLISPKFTWKVLEQVVKEQSKSNNVELKSVNLGKAMKKGDSYLSTVTRFSVDYSTDQNGKTKTLYVIAKALLRNIAQRKTFRSTDFFKNEISFYEKIWPQLDALQKEAKVKDLFQEIPNYLGGHYDGENDYILLEDLSFQDYQGIDRSAAMDLDSVKMIIKIFARFHALGVALRQKKPELFETTAAQLDETYFHDKFRIWYLKFHANLKAITIDAVEKELPREYFTKLESIFKRDIYKEASNLCAGTSKFTTITHGDAWVPNFLTRYDELMQPLHSYMIDFQLTRRASLAQDLHFFIYSCTDDDLRAKSYKDILNYYCQEFNGFYNQLNGSESGEFLKLHDLMSELKENGIFGLCMSMEALVMSMLDDDEVSDLEALEGKEAVPIDTVWIIKPLTTAEKRVRLAKFFKHMMDNQFI